MNQDEIIEMARQVGFDFSNGWRDNGETCQYGEAWPEQIEAFSKLVAAKEREACAKLCENFADVDSGPDGIEQDYHAKLIRARGEA